MQCCHRLGVNSIGIIVQTLIFCNISVVTVDILLKARTGCIPVVTVDILLRARTSYTPFPKQTIVFTCLLYKSFENTVEKGEIAYNEQFLLFSSLFSTYLENLLPFSSV